MSDMFSKNKIPIISLFCGCGGFDLGFTKARFEILLALDVNSTVVRTYNHNHGDGIAQQCDLHKAAGADIIQILTEKGPHLSPRGVIGGCPCQSFSNGNVYHKKRDLRHTLPRKYAAILRV